MANPWETAGRERKVTRITEHFDRVFRKKGHDPFSKQSLELMLHMVKTATAQDWKAWGAAGGFNAPRDHQTVDAVAAVLERKLSWADADPFARCGSHTHGGL